MKKKISSFFKNQLDYILVITILLLFAIGLVMVLSASSPTALAEDGNSYTYFSKQAILGIIGIVIMFFLSKIDYRIYQKFYKFAYILSLGLLVMVLLVGRELNGATRWIYLTETFSFQPSEIVKICMIIFYAGFLVKNKKNIDKLGKGTLVSLGLLIPILGLLYLQPHYSSLAVIGMVSIIIMLVAGIKIKHMAGLSFIGLPVAIGLMLADKYRVTRVITFLDPWKDITGDGWQIIQSLYAIGSGGIFGVGLGGSKQKYSYIPEAHNDFIFSIIGEELGFVGCTIILILFGILIWRGIIIAMKAPDTFGSLVAIGLTSLIAVQVIINIAVVTSSMPVTGMPLPFFSYGGTALTILLASMGILLNISRASNKT